MDRSNIKDRDNDEADGHESDSSDSSENSETIESLEKEIQEVNEAIEIEVFQFNYLTDSLKKEKTNHLKRQAAQLYDGTLPEFTQPMEEMRKEKAIRLHRAKLLRDFKQENSRQRYEAEMEIIEQDYENEKQMLIERVQEEIENEIKMLEEERKRADKEFQYDLDRVRRSQNENVKERRRMKPVSVSSPFVIYELPEEAIAADLLLINSLHSETTATS